MTTPDVMAELGRLLAERKNATPESSYVSSLYHKGLDKILKKVGEECTETVMAAKDAQVDGKTEHLIYETADLWFHTLVMLGHFNIPPEAVISELARRLHVSGHA